MGVRDLSSAAVTPSDASLIAAALASGSATYGPIRGSRPGNATVFLGDSITARYDDAPVNFRGTSFPVYASIISGQRIGYRHNAGVSGDQTNQMIARFDTDVTPYAPAAVVILGGTNDTGHSVALSSIQANIKAIVAKVYAIGAKPVLCTIPPRDDATPLDLHQRISALNHWLRRYAADKGIPLVDFHALLTDPATGHYLAAYYNDGTHPNAAADAAMGQLLANVLSPQMPSTAPPLPADNIDANNFMRNGFFLSAINGTDWTNNAGVNGQTLTTVAGDPTIAGSWARYDTVASDGVSLLYQGQAGSYAGTLLVPGNRYAMVGRVKVNSLSAGQSWACTLRFSGGVTTDFSAAYNLDQPLTNGGIFYIEGVAPAGSTNAYARLSLSAGTGSIQFAQVGIFDLTAIGTLN